MLELLEPDYDFILFDTPTSDCSEFELTASSYTCDGAGHPLGKTTSGQIAERFAARTGETPGGC